MGYDPKSTLFFGVELVDFHNYRWDDDDMPDEPTPYDYGWQSRLGERLGIEQKGTESELSYEERVVKEANVRLIDAGDNNYDTLTIGIVESVVSCDWNRQSTIDANHPIRQQTSVNDDWLSQLQRFCDVMLNVKVNIKELYDDGKVGWRLAAYYPSG